MDALINEAATILDEEKSLELVRQAARIVADDAGALFVSRTQELVPMQKAVKGYVHRKALTQYLMYHELYRD